MKNTWSYGLLALVLFGFFALISSSRISQQGVGAADKEYVFLVTKCVESTSGGSFFTKPETFVDVSFDIISLPQNVTVVSNSSRRIRVTNNTIGLNNFLGISFFSEKYPNISFDEYKNKIDWRISQGVSCSSLNSDFIRSGDRPTVPAGGILPVVSTDGTSSIPPTSGIISQCAAFVQYPQAMVAEEMKDKEKFEFKYSFCFGGHNCELESVFVDQVPPEKLRERVSEAVKNDILSWFNKKFDPDFERIEDVPGCSGFLFSGLEDAVKNALKSVTGAKSLPIIPVPDLIISTGNCTFKVSGLSIRKGTDVFYINYKQFCTDTACFLGKNLEIKGKELKKSDLDKAIKDAHGALDGCDMYYFGIDDIDKLLKEVNYSGVKNPPIIPVPDPFIVPSGIPTVDEINEIIREQEEKKKEQVDSNKLRIGYVPNKCESFISDPQKEGQHVASLFINGDRFKEFETIRGSLAKDKESAYLERVALYAVFPPNEKHGFSVQSFDARNNKWDVISIIGDYERLTLNALGDKTYVLIDNKPGTPIADFTRVATYNNNLKLTDFIECVFKFNKECQRQNKPAAVNPVGQQQVKTQPSGNPKIDSVIQKLIKDHPQVRSFVFTATWCGPCKTFHARNKRKEEQGIIVPIDVDKYPDIARFYGIRSMPTEINIDKFGNPQK